MTTIPLDQRLLASTIGALELFGVYLGDRLGLYRALRDGGPTTPAGLAGASGIHPRYAREWLEQQAVAGVLVVDDPAAPAGDRRYALPAEHAGVLVDASDPAHLAPLARMIAGIGGVIDEVANAYRTGEASRTPATAPTSATDRAASTGPHSRPRSSASGCRRYRASPGS